MKKNFKIKTKIKISFIKFDEEFLKNSLSQYIKYKLLLNTCITNLNPLEKLNSINFTKFGSQMPQNKNLGSFSLKYVMKYKNIRT